MRYAETCRTDFWTRVFDAETEYLAQHLPGRTNVLSIGCGPAVIEGELGKQGFRVTGLDVSAEALRHAPRSVRTLVGRAEDMPFESASFDSVIFVASLQFVENYTEALAETARVLCEDGVFIAMLLNPRSAYFKQKSSDPRSYVSKITHPELAAIERAAAAMFLVETEYFLGIKNDTTFESADPTEAALYVLRGVKKQHAVRSQESP